MALTLQGNQYLPSGHVLQPSIGLEPLPFLTKYHGNVGAAAVPMFMDNVLDKRNVFVKKLHPGMRGKGTPNKG